MAVIWDVDTKGQVRWLDGHVKIITSVECVCLNSLSVRAGADRLQLVPELALCSDLLKGLERDHMGSCIRHRPSAPSGYRPIRRSCRIRLISPQEQVCFRFIIAVSAVHNVINSQILLVLLSSGEVFIVDLRREYKGRYELCEVQDESDDEAQMNRARYVMS